MKTRYNGGFEEPSQLSLFSRNLALLKEQQSWSTPGLRLPREQVIFYSLTTVHIEENQLREKDREVAFVHIENSINIFPSLRKKRLLRPVFENLMSDT